MAFFFAIRRSSDLGTNQRRRLTSLRMLSRGGGTRLQHIIYAEEEAKFLTPPTVFGISHGMVVPVLLAYAIGSWTVGLIWMFRMTKVDL